MPDTEFEYRYFEVRAVGRLLTGVAMKYGDIARTPAGQERFISGAFGDVSKLDLRLNVQHDRGRLISRTGGGGLELTDTPEALTVAAELPRTREADDTLELLKRGILRGLSVEFRATLERLEQRVRVVQTAILGGLAVVDVPAFKQSTVEARADEPPRRRRRLWL